MINKNHECFQYNSGDLVYIISPLTSQLRTASRKVAIKYVGPLVIYKSVDPPNYLLMTLDGKILRGLFKHERLKPATVRTSHGNINTLNSAYNKKKYAEILPRYRWLFIKGNVFISEWGIFGAEVFLRYSQFFIKGDFIIGRVECSLVQLKHVLTGMVI